MNTNIEKITISKEVLEDYVSDFNQFFQYFDPDVDNLQAQLNELNDLIQSFNGSLKIGLKYLDQNVIEFLYELKGLIKYFLKFGKNQKIIKSKSKSIPFLKRKEDPFMERDGIANLSEYIYNITKDFSIDELTKSTDGDRDNNKQTGNFLKNTTKKVLAIIK